MFMCIKNIYAYKLHVLKIGLPESFCEISERKAHAMYCISVHMYTFTA